MSRTTKWEHPSDSFHTNHRDERRARPAGRIVAMVEAELAADAEDELDEHIFDEAEWPSGESDLYEFRDSPCGGYCRRCLIHGDPGGCLG